jgi:NitT/TauT family transport system ATP-binding protein
MSENEVLVCVKNVCQTLGGMPILKEVCFDVVDRVRTGIVTGQIVALLGPSGVGKTRLIRILSGLDAPDSGEVHGIAGKPIEAGHVGVVFQSYPLLKHRTVLGNLVTAGKCNGLSGAAALAKAKDLLLRFRLDNRAHFYPAQLSGGQRQRVAIAQQMVRQKTLLLMDEPFSGLDPASLDEVSELLVEVANMDELNTIIVVTHDIRAAMIVSDTLFLLGRDRDEKGNLIPGAKIKATVDLVAKGLAWRKHVELEAAFLDLEREIRGQFKTL